MPDDSCILEEPQRQRTREPTLAIDRIIEPEFKGSVFRDPNFFKNFLPLVPSPNGVVGLCLKYDQHLRTHYEWEFPDVVEDEKSLHKPVLRLLNSIKSATDIIRNSLPDLHTHTVPNLTDTNPPMYKDYDLPLAPEIRHMEFSDRNEENFVDCSSLDLTHTLSEELVHHLRPDIVLFGGKWKHWSNIRFIVEIKEHPQHLAAGIKQLARYAHVVFAQQPSRRHFYSLLICGLGAIFVRFDHAGILYSRLIDVARNPAFVTAFASLLSLNGIDQGLDPAFKYSADGYYIDLLECMLGKDSRVAPGDEPGIHDDRAPTKTRQFRIMRQYYHSASRKRVNGPGTFVLHIRECFPLGSGGGQEMTTKQGEVTRLDTSNGTMRPPAEYILKLSWRLDNNKPEGSVLEEVEGTFGVPQHLSHGDIVIPGKCKCVLPLGVQGSQTQCTTCVDRTPVLDELQVWDNFRDLSVHTPLDSDDRVPPGRVDLGKIISVPKSARVNRIYSYVLFSSFGRPIQQAESPKIYVVAIMDAILGYWGLYNLGIIHREITLSNLLVLTKKQQFARRRWEETDHEIKDPVLADSEKELRIVLKELGNRDPTGMLIDLTTYQRLEPAISLPIFNPVVTHKEHTSAHSENDHQRVKRRKVHSGDPIVAPPVMKRRRRGVRRTPNIGDGPQPPFDYVTISDGQFSSTPIMRAISAPKQPYRHHFYDDLESFFWVMLWSAISHVDPGKARNRRAMTFLLDFSINDTRRSDVSWKENTLEDCRISSGNVTLARLNACENEWASNRLLQNVIVTVGGYIGILRNEEREEGIISSPGEAFGTIIRFIQGELKVDAQAYTSGKRRSKY